MSRHLKVDLSSMTKQILIFLFFANFAFAQNFSTGGGAIKNGVSGSINGDSVIFVSELEGTTSAHTTEGTLLWRNETDSPAVMFEIEASDINNDGNDDLIAASGNGNIYCWDSSGKLLWKFTPDHKVRFSEVAVINQNGKVQIFAGGNDYKLYELDANGQLVSETKIKGVVRKIEAGNFIEPDKQCLFLMTYNHDKFRWQFFGFIDPISKEIIKSLPYRDATKYGLKAYSKIMITDFVVSDINKDKKDDILIFGDINWKSSFLAVDGDFRLLAKYNATGKDTQRYAHTKGVSLLPYKDEIVFRMGSVMYVCDLKGNLISKTGKKYKNATYSDLVFDAQNKKLFAVGELGAGNSIYGFDLENKNWLDTKHQYLGLYSKVKENINDLYKDALNFKAPSYQKKASKPWMMISKTKLPKEVKKLDFNEVLFIQNSGAWSENTSRADLVEKLGENALKKDRRKKYDLSREDIIEKAKQKEEANEPFVIWAGHGNDPFYTRIETLEKILEAAPNTCYGFIYAEMDNVEDPRVLHFVREYVPRLAKAIRKNNKAKLYFRYKNMFWAMTSHLPLWKELFFSGKYNDILVPASEDTSSRSQEINLVGRVGMLSAGYIDDYSMRLIDDNPTSWRPLSPGGQRTVSPYLRQGVMMAAHGCRIGINFNELFLEKPGMNVLYALMKSGVLPLVEKEDILNIGSWHLIDEVDEHLVESIDSHHNLLQYKDDDDNAVLSVAQMHWSGTSLPEHDFSKIVLGTDYRWNNYLPELPYGMVPIVPSEHKSKLEANNTPFILSTGKVGIVGGEKTQAKEFGGEILSKVKEGAEKLPVLVEGCAWGAVKLDENHTRIILMDQGYLTPEEREATIIFQNRKPKYAKDILKDKKLKIKRSTIKVTVPAGSMRFIDVEY
ncbi:hypothetical protein Q4Q39_00395 [Flavivirga amylovorans]|uniref:Uncharacterized protein n=1 Tax=Flavivirga amylovorans TaxID=870486 RepID=A0ABT8WVZ8_9FLAO|nr:hypothetical protein [Flavivirga amylovorans]MDO5985849.1 hypothetical protein [Flavivirga amylovorans]